LNQRNGWYGRWRLDWACRAARMKAVSRIVESLLPGRRRDIRYAKQAELISLPFLISLSRLRLLCIEQREESRGKDPEDASGLLSARSRMLSGKRRPTDSSLRFERTSSQQPLRLAVRRLVRSHTPIAAFIQTRELISYISCESWDVRPACGRPVELKDLI
jgi:hypothetical protein